MAKNKKKELIELKKKANDDLMGVLCDIKDYLEEEIERLENVASKEYKDGNVNLPILDMNIVNCMSGEKIIDLSFNDVFEINHITKNVEDITSEFMQKKVALLNAICGTNVEYQNCKMLCKPLDLKINYNERCNEIVINTKHSNACGVLSEIYEEIDYNSQNRHPHIQHTACLGGYSALLINALKNQDILSFTTTLKRYLNSADILDGWGRSLITSSYVMYDYVNDVYYLRLTTNNFYSNMIIAFTPSDVGNINLKWYCFYYTPTHDRRNIHTTYKQEINKEFCIRDLIEFHLSKENYYIDILNPLEIYLRSVDSGCLVNYYFGNDRFIVSSINDVINKRKENLEIFSDDDYNENEGEDY